MTPSSWWACVRQSQVPEPVAAEVLILCASLSFMLWQEELGQTLIS
jgi:hypothetical protein